MDPTPSWAWIVFGAVMLTALAIDLFGHRGGREETHRRSVIWAVIWISVGLGFGAFIAAVLGGEKAGDYLAAYLLEESLSIDNLFVFLVIFQSLKIAPEHQRSVLTWGIFGALVFRALFIILGIEAIERWDWVVYVFGAILLWAAIKIFREDPAEKEENKIVGWLSKHLPLTPEVKGHHFVVKKEGRRVGTPLLVALLGAEATDILFAIDSVPAAFSVTTDKFIIYSSNAFAILGLRSLYAVLAKAISELEYLHYGLAAVLAFAGIKLVLSNWVHIEAPYSIGVIVLCVGGAVWASLRVRKKRARQAGSSSRERPGKARGKQPAEG